MAQSWLPSSYAFSNMFADFPAGSIRNYSQTVSRPSLLFQDTDEAHLFAAPCHCPTPGQWSTPQAGRGDPTTSQRGLPCSDHSVGRGCIRKSASPTAGSVGTTQSQEEAARGQALARGCVC